MMGDFFIMEHTSFNAVYNERRIYISGENTVHCIDMKNKKQIWETAAECSGNFYLEQMQIQDSPYDSYKGKVLFSIYDNQITARSCEEGKVLQNNQYESPIVGFQIQKNRIVAMHENGMYSWSAYQVDKETERKSISYQPLFQKNSKVVRNGEIFYVLEQDDSDMVWAKGIIKYQLEKQDSSYHEILKKEKQEDYFSYKPVGDGWQYVIKNNKVYFADCNSGKQYEAEFPGEEEIESSYDIKMLGFSEDHKKAYFYKQGFYERQFSIYQVNIEEQTIEEKKCRLRKARGWKILCVPMASVITLPVCRKRKM